MTYRTLAATLFAMLMWIDGAQAGIHLNDHQEDAGELGTVLQYAVPAAAFALTFVLEPQPSETARRNPDAGWLFHLNGSPRHDLALAIVRSGLVTGTLKIVVNETRPNGGEHSFPSGHTSLAFAGAEFIRKEYGWGWGIPAYATASYVGWSRVEAKAHYPHDVIAGAAIGILSNHDWNEFHTRAGDLTVAPALLEVPHDDTARAAAKAGVAPGLHFNLRF